MVSFLFFSCLLTVGESSSPRGHDHDAHFLSTSAEDVGREEKRAGALVERVGAQKTRPESRVAQHPGGSEGLSTADNEMTSVVALAVEESGTAREEQEESTVIQNCNEEGKVDNPGNCMCGSKMCIKEEDADGDPIPLYCDTRRPDARKCKPNPTCADETGTTATEENCHCGENGKKCEITFDGEPINHPKYFCDTSRGPKEQCFNDCEKDKRWKEAGTTCRCTSGGNEAWCSFGDKCKIKANGDGKCKPHPNPSA